MAKYPILTSKIRISDLEIRNRMFTPAMHLGLTPDGLCSSGLVDYYRQIAAGGTGLIVVGGVAVNREGGEPMMLLLYNKKHMDALKPLTKAISTEGAIPAIQLFHAGRYASGKFNGVPSLSSSAIKSPLAKETPREMTMDDINRTVKDFAISAELAVQAGFQAIQIIMSAGYIFNQFFSDVVNHRTDEYGGSLENRTRFAVQVIQAVKSAVTVPVGVRISGADFVPNGNGPDEQVEIARILAKAGVDWFDVTGGWHESRVPQITMEVPTAGFAFLARRIRDAVALPVVLSNRVRDPGDAEKLLQWGYADAINLGRQIIADPQYPNKVTAGKTKTIRPCLSCNEGCLDKVFSAQPVDCVVNPNYVPLIKTTKGKVAVVGAGPAGLEAAMLLNDAGLDVTVFEASAHIGGQLNLAMVPPGRSEYKRMIDFYSLALQDRSIKLYTNKIINNINQLEPFNAIIWAGGARPTQPKVPGDGPMHSAWDVLSGAYSPGRRVLVLGGGATGIETAIFLAAEGTMTPEQLRFHVLFNSVDIKILRQELLRGFRQVTVAEMADRAGNGIGKSSRWVILSEARAFGVRLMTSTELKSWDGHRAILHSGNNEIQSEFDDLIYAVGVRPQRPEFLDKINKPLVIIGDAQQPLNLGSAIRSARHGVDKLLKML